jgi:YVTN family beta-propeller protein
MRSTAWLVACAATLFSISRAEVARARPLLAVSAEAGGDVVLIDPAKATIIERINVGARPRGVKLSKDGKRLLVAVAGAPKAAAKPGAAAAQSAGLAIIDVAARKVAKHVTTPPSPFAVELSPDGRTAFLSNNETNEVFVVDVGAGTVLKKAPVGREPQGLAVRRDGKAVFVATHGTDEISVIDPKTANLSMRIDGGARPQTLLLAPRGDSGFVIDEGNPIIMIIDTKGKAFKQELPLMALVRATPAAALQSGVLSPDGKILYVTNGPGRSVAFVDLEKKTVAAVVDGVGTFPRGIAISPDGKKLYTANGPSNDVAVIDVATKKVEARIPVPGAPWGVTLAP